jgi:hypothetical protein
MIAFQGLVLTRSKKNTESFYYELDQNPLNKKIEGTWDGDKPLRISTMFQKLGYFISRSCSVKKAESISLEILVMQIVEASTIWNTFSRCFTHLYLICLSLFFYLKKIWVFIFFKLIKNFIGIFLSGANQLSYSFKFCFVIWKGD